MDEPASALDPIATQKIEELVYELKSNYTIVIVTHNMQQAARVSDRTAFFMTGKLVEYAETNTIFMNPKQKLTEDYITRSEEHTSELQSPCNLVCRLLLEKKKPNSRSRTQTKLRQ